MKFVDWTLATKAYYLPTLEDLDAMNIVCFALLAMAQSPVVINPRMAVSMSTVDSPKAADADRWGLQRCDKPILTQEDIHQYSWRCFHRGT